MVPAGSPGSSKWAEASVPLSRSPAHFRSEGRHLSSLTGLTFRRKGRTVSKQRDSIQRLFICMFPVLPGAQNSKLRRLSFSLQFIYVYGGWFSLAIPLGFSFLGGNSPICSRGLNGATRTLSGSRTAGQDLTFGSRLGEGWTWDPTLSDHTWSWK